MLEVGRAVSGRRISDIRGSGTRVELSRSNSGAGELEGRVEDGGHRGGGPRNRIQDATLSSIDFTLSIQNVALLNAISCSIVDTLKTPEIEPNLLPLSTVELSKIKKLSSALQKNDDAWESESAALAAGSAGVAAGDDPTAGGNRGRECRRGKFA